MTGPVVRVADVHKRFRLGFLGRRRIHAVGGISLSVGEGEVVGFLGPNGAGKTTTLKMLIGLVRPTSGTIEVLGRPVGDPRARAAVGFLPESPYFYGYLDAFELCDLKGRLHGLDRPTRRRRAGELLERVGLGAVRGRPLRTFSKGMLQRVGLAQALMGEPRIVLLDEPQTGLDPIGRKQVRDLIRDLRNEGRAVLFSTHVLSDVEMVCDRVALLVRGQLRAVGPLAELVRPQVVSTEVVVEGGGRLALPEQVAAVVERTKVEEDGAAWFLARTDAGSDALVAAAVGQGLRVRAVLPQRETLEDLFVREAGP